MLYFQDREDAVTAVREGSWQGRAGGLDSLNSKDTDAVGFGRMPRPGSSSNQRKKDLPPIKDGKVSSIQKDTIQ